MLTLIHGDNQVASRKKLVELIAVAKVKQQEITQLSAEGLGRAKLESALLSSNLFGTGKVVVIEGLYSLPKSKKKDELISLITSTASGSAEIILWDKKTVGKLEQKKLPKDFSNYEYKITQQLWTFLDQLSGAPTGKKALLTLYRESVASDDSEFIFLMVARQIRLLIQVKEGHASKLAPFILNKLTRQAKNFTLEALLKLHHQLYQIDQRQKQSSNFLSLEAELDLWLLSM